MEQPERRVLMGEGQRCVHLGPGEEPPWVLVVTFVDRSTWEFGMCLACMQAATERPVVLDPAPEQPISFAVLMNAAQWRRRNGGESND